MLGSKPWLTWKGHQAENAWWLDGWPNWGCGRETFWRGAAGSGRVVATLRPGSDPSGPEFSTPGAPTPRVDPSDSGQVYEQAPRAHAGPTSGLCSRRPDVAQVSRIVRVAGHFLAGDRCGTEHKLGTSSGLNIAQTRSLSPSIGAMTRRSCSRRSREGAHRSTGAQCPSSPSLSRRWRTLPPTDTVRVRARAPAYGRHWEISFECDELRPHLRQGPGEQLQQHGGLRARGERLPPRSRRRSSRGSHPRASRRVAAERRRFLEARGMQDGASLRDGLQGGGCRAATIRQRHRMMRAVSLSPGIGARVGREPIWPSSGRSALDRRGRFQRKHRGHGNDAWSSARAAARAQSYTEGRPDHRRCSPPAHMCARAARSKRLLDGAPQRLVSPGNAGRDTRAPQPGRGCGHCPAAVPQKDIRPSATPLLCEARDGLARRAHRSATAQGVAGSLAAPSQCSRHSQRRRHSPWSAQGQWSFRSRRSRRSPWDRRGR